MGLKIFYHPKVLTEDIPSLSKTVRLRIKKAIENKLLTYPQTFGEPLRGSLVPLWKLRVGDNRIVFDVEGNKVYIHAIGHRKHIYTHMAQNRVRSRED